MHKEIRTATASLKVETRDDDELRLVGHAAVFNSLSEDLGGFRERIEPGAFRSSLGGDVRALFNHDTNFVLGRTTSGTLSISEDERGLRVDISPPANGFMRDLVMAPIERGDINQMSFGFRVRAGGSRFEEDDDGNVIRTLSDIELFEVSPVTFPAYPDTDIASREYRSFIEGKNGSVNQSLMPEIGHDSIGRMKKIHASVSAKEKRGADWLEVRNADSDGPVDILMYDAIGLFGTEPKEFIRMLDSFRGRALNIRINSPGGSVFDGAAIYNALRSHDAPVNVQIDGLAASMAGIIAMAGNRITMNQNAFFMMHNASGCVWGSASQMEHEAELLRKIDKSIGKTLAIRSGKDEREIKAMLDHETWLSAEEAKASGFVDEVLHETGANIRHHDLSHFRNVPPEIKEIRKKQVRVQRMRLAQRSARMLPSAEKKLASNCR